MTPDYLSYEVSKAAYKLVKEVMLVEPGENVVVTGDTSTDKRVLDAIMNAAYIVGANPVLVYCPTTDAAYAEPVAPVAYTHLCRGLCQNKYRYQRKWRRSFYLM